MVKKRFPDKIVKFTTYSIIGIIALIVFFILWWYVELLLYQPLSNEDFENLFPKGATYKKISSRDGLKLTIHGEFYELHTYRVCNGIIRNDYPKKVDRLGGYDLPQEMSLYQWTDSLILENEFNEFLLPQSMKISRRFEKEWKNVSNFRCCFFVSESESYWFVFCPLKRRLYYLVFNL